MDKIKSNIKRFKLVEPNIKHKEQAIEYINEFRKNNSSINGVGGLDRYLNNYEEWLIKLENDKNRIPDENKVPAETFFLIRENDNRIIGMINIRLVLNERLKKSSGNIGYSIRPSERRKGYNKINLYLGLLECKKHGLKKVMLDCDKDNLGSAKTIQALCGKLEKEYYDNKMYNCMVQVYWIDVDYAIKSKANSFQQYIV